MNTLVAVGLVAGIALRVWILASSQGALDGDEAVWGLMARHVLHGELSTFYWGQAYGGSQETLVAAGLFWLFGASTVVLKLTAILFWAGASVLVWRVGRRTIGEPQARLAAALFWMWPLFFIWKSTRAHGFYGAGLVFGLWAMLAALRLRERSAMRDAAQLGLALGLGWWATPQIAILGLPPVLWLVWRRPAVLRAVPVAAGAFVLGSLPWWIYNVRHHWASVHAGRDESSAFGHLHNLFSSTLPAALGLRLPFSLEWLPHVAVGAPLYVLALAGFAWLLIRRPAGLGMLLLTAALFPIFYTASPYTWLNVEPRYLTLLAPVIVLLVAYAAHSTRRAVMIFLICGALSISGLALMVSDDLAASHAGGVALPADFGPLVRKLEANGVRRVWATYWIAYRVTFESGERIVAAEPGSDRYSVRQGRVVPLGESDIGNQGRYAPFQHEVAKSRDVAHVFAAGEPLEGKARPLLRSAGYRLVTVDGFDVWLPPR
jgi:4-amino-4-deoxy-L-arabinose transferase-like glycosyltransferase